MVVTMLSSYGRDGCEERGRSGVNIADKWRLKPGNGVPGSRVYMPGLVNMATAVGEGLASTRSIRTRTVPRWLKPRRLAAA